VSRHILTTSLRRALNAVPRSRFLFKLSRLYVNFYEGQDDPDFQTNGEARALRSLLPGCRLAFDVGAHVGDWTALAIEINHSLEVHCFEPSAESYRQLELRHGAAPNVRLNPVGLSTDPGEATLHIHEKQPDIDSLYASSDSTGAEPVRLRSVDEYCESEKIDHIDYLKVDTEGHEYAILLGAERMLRAGRVRYAQVEYGPAYLDAGTSLRDVMRLLEDCGYRPYKILPRGPEPVSYSRSLENFTLSNWLFVRADAGL
jgi:FkbM family methyltransferase